MVSCARMVPNGSLWEKMREPGSAMKPCPVVWLAISDPLVSPSLGVVGRGAQGPRHMSTAEWPGFSGSHPMQSLNHQGLSLDSTWGVGGGNVTGTCWTKLRTRQIALPWDPGRTVPTHPPPSFLPRLPPSALPCLLALTFLRSGVRLGRLIHASFS